MVKVNPFCLEEEDVNYLYSLCFALISMTTEDTVLLPALFLVMNGVNNYDLSDLPNTELYSSFMSFLDACCDVRDKTTWRESKLMSVCD